MRRIEGGLRQIVAYTVGGVALLAFVLFLRALFMVQGGPAAQVSPIDTPTPPPPPTPFPPSPTPFLLSESTFTPMPATEVSPTPDVAALTLTAPGFTPTPPSGRDFYRLQRLTNDAFGEYRPAVSPDGRYIAFASERDGNWDIYVLDRSTNTEQRLTDDAVPDMSPSWSPDGSFIAYQHNNPNPAGPVLVDHVVMNSDGSNKSVIASGAVWRGNEPPAWPLPGDRIAFTDSRDVVVMSVADRREVTRFTPPGVQAYFDPVWFDSALLAFTSDGALMIGDTTSGEVKRVDGTPGFARLPMTTLAYPRIAYVGLNGPEAYVASIYPNGNEPYALAVLQAGLIDHAAWSRDGRFIAVQTDLGVQVVIAWTPQYQPNAPLFNIATSTAPSDLLSVAWLPDSSGFVFPAEIDGQPDLYWAQLNESAIEAFVITVPSIPPTLVAPPTAWESPTPWVTPTLSLTPTSLPPGLAHIAFWPEPGTELDRSLGFDFGADIAYNAQEQTIAHIAAFQLYPGETPSDCMTPSIPLDRQFWAEQQTFDPGPFTFGRRFFYAELPGTDRLVVRASVIRPDVIGQVLYCEQEVYPLVSVIGTSTPTPPMTLTP
jgi:Tol biopolymer transport system component